MGRAGGRGGGGSRGGSSGGSSRGGSFGGSRGGSFGGGSRSSRSSSGSSFGSSRSYSSGSRPRTSGGYGGFWGTPRVSGPVIINNSGNRNYNSSGNNGNYSNNNKRSDNNGKGCLHIALIIVMILSIIVTLFCIVGVISSSGEERTKLDADVNETGYFTDELGWINDSATLIEGMEHFYDLTGVQPYLYITDNVGGSFYDYAEEFADNKYDELFTDEAHLLLVFHEKDDWYDTYCLAGSAANAVIDSEARMILLDTLDEYYYDSSLDDNEYFSKSFADAADEIMQSSSVSMSVVIVPLGIFIIALAVDIAIRKKEKEEKRKKELKEMLDKPLETFGSTEASELAKKYETTEKKENTAETQNSENCVKCGSVLEEDSNFCSSCGTKIEK